jgi:hypothetical protein
VQRYASALPAGDYTLSLSSQSAGSSIFLFMFDANGQLVSDGQTGWIVATADQPTGTDPTQNATGAVQFTVPQGVTSFAIQVQGPWAVNEFTSVSDLALQRVTGSTDPGTTGPFANGIPGELADTNVECRDRTIVNNEVTADSGPVAKTYFVDNGLFVAGLDDGNSASFLHEVWGSDDLYCVNPSRTFIDSNPPTGGPPGLSAATRTDLADGSIRFTLPPTRGTISVQWKRVELASGDVEYQWDSDGYSQQGQEQKRLIVDANGQFKSCYFRFDLIGASTGDSITELKSCGEPVPGVTDQ